jgi:hypothetical protein
MKEKKTEDGGRGDEERGYVEGRKVVAGRKEGRKEEKEGRHSWKDRLWTGDY